MSEKEKLEKAYRDLQIEEAPDLWARIEARLGEEVPASDLPTVRFRRGHYRLASGLAAAACLVLVVIGGRTFRQAYQKAVGEMAGASEMAAETRAEMPTETTAAGAYIEETAAIRNDEPEATEAAMPSAQMEATKAVKVPTQPETAALPETTAAMPAQPEATEAVKVPAQPETTAAVMSPGACPETAEEASPMEDPPVNPKQVFDVTDGAGLAVKDGVHDRVISYDSLVFRGNPVPIPDELKVYNPADSQYFTEKDLRLATLICLADVDSLSFETNADGEFLFVTYEISIDKVLYSENHVEEGQKLTVRTSVDRENALYQLDDGGRYVLPLKAEKDGFRLVFPSSPQIQVTEDNRYLFHNGWTSLMDGGTSFVMMKRHRPEDYYYDRMVLRDDENFLSNLTELAAQTRRNERKDYEKM